MNFTFWLLEVEYCFVVLKKVDFVYSLEGLHSVFFYDSFEFLKRKEINKISCKKYKLYLCDCVFLKDFFFRILLALSSVIVVLWTTFFFLRWVPLPPRVVDSPNFSANFALAASSFIYSSVFWVFSASML